MQFNEITVEGSPTAGQAPAPAPAPSVIRPTPGEVAITRPDGRVQTVGEADLADAIAQGDRPATSAEYTNARMGAAGPAASFITEGVRTATLGLSDVALVEGDKLIEGDAEGERMRQALREMREVNPGANIAGTIAGSLAPLALGSPTGAVSAVEGVGALARAGSRIAAVAPRAFLEGAAIGFGDQFSEDYLGNHEMTAQKFLASSLKGGLMAVVIGGGLSAGLGHVGDKLAGLRGRTAVEAIEHAAEGGPFRSLGKVGELARGRSSLSRLSDIAEEQAAKGAMPSASLAGSEMQKLGATAEQQQSRIRRIGRTLLDEGITTPGATKAVQAQRLTARAAEVGEELGALRRSFDRAAARPSAEGIMRRVETEVLDPLVARAFTGPEQAAVTPFVRELGERLGASVDDAGNLVFKSPVVDSFETLHKLRRELDAKLKWDKGIPPPTPALKELRAIRGILEEEFESAAERAAAELGESTASQYRTSKALYADLKTAEKWATKGAARDAQNRAISLTDTIMAGAAIASGHPMGLLAPLANKAVRTFGNQAAAVVLDRATRIQGIQRAAQAFDDRLDRAVLAFFGKGKALPASTSASERVSPQAARALREAARNPGQLADRAAEVVARTGLSEDAPRTAQAMVSTFMRAGTWIASRLPPEPPPRALTFGPSKPRPLGPKAQKEVDNAFRALDADAFVDDLSRGRVDRQALEAMKFINPELHMEVVGKLRKYGIENRPDLSRQQAVALSIITGEPMTPLMQPKTIQGFQQAYAQEEPPMDPSAPGMTAKKQIGSGAPPPGRAQSTRAFASGTDKMEAANGS